jgi:dTDP-4-dehydrorhamnose 3,5-epimerase
LNIIEVKELELEGVKVIRFGRFRDDRGYFTEHYRKSDILAAAQGAIGDFLQCNESYSRAGTIRGLHFQWNPHMGKMVRTLSGRMIDLVLDVRKGSPTFGKIIAYDLPARREGDFDEWIWIPPGFAHGNLFDRESLIEYMCTSEYSPGNEGTISPFARDIDWSLCSPSLKAVFDHVAATTTLVTDKDRNGSSLTDWAAGPLSEKFLYSGPKG